MIFIWIVLPIIAIGVVIFYLLEKFTEQLISAKAKWKSLKEHSSNSWYGINFNTGSCIERNLVFCSFTFGSIPAYHRSNNVDWKKVRKNDDMPKAVSFLHRTGIVAIALTVAILTYGYFNIFNVISTNYTVTTEKNIRSEGYKLALISDLHYGITLNKEQLEKVVERINKESPDIVILDGDLVDESTTLPQMKEAFKTLWYT